MVEVVALPVDKPVVGGVDEYQLEVEDFADCVLSGRAPAVVSNADTLANMRTIDALYASAASGSAVTLGG